jgi:4-hydroxybenzoate polyprenyltransferase
MHKTTLAYFQLIRLPNVVTAAADSLAGWLLVTGSLSAQERWLPLLGSSMVLYASGTMLNDVFDFEVDRVERPGRPLPSGKVSRRVAGWLGGLGLALGPCLALASGSAASGLLAAVLALAILGYDIGLKHTWLGPAAMGACRGMNFLLGMTHVVELGGPIAWLAALAYAIFVAGITIASRSEAVGGGLARPSLLTGLLLQLTAIVTLAAVGFSRERFPAPKADLPIVPLEGLLVLALVAFAVSVAASRAMERPLPEFIQKYIKTGILSLVWLHVGVIAAVRGPVFALPIAALWFPAFILGRWLYST